MSSSFSKMTYKGVQYVPLSEAQAEIEQLEGANRVLGQWVEGMERVAAARRDEIDRLRGEVERLRAALRTIAKNQMMEVSDLPNFKELRHDKRHHLGLGDVRLTIAQQDAIDAEIERLRAGREHWYCENCGCERCIKAEAALEDEK